MYISSTEWAIHTGPGIMALPINSHESGALLQGFLLRKQVICLKGQEAGATGPGERPRGQQQPSKRWLLKLRRERHSLQICLSLFPQAQADRHQVLIQPSTGWPARIKMNGIIQTRVWEQCCLIFFSRRCQITSSGTSSFTHPPIPPKNVQ